MWQLWMTESQNVSPSAAATGGSRRPRVATPRRLGVRSCGALRGPRSTKGGTSGPPSGSLLLRGDVRLRTFLTLCQVISREVSLVFQNGSVLETLKAELRRVVDRKLATTSIRLLRRSPAGYQNHHDRRMPAEVLCLSGRPGRVDTRQLGSKLPDRAFGRCTTGQRADPRRPTCALTGQCQPDTMLARQISPPQVAGAASDVRFVCGCCVDAVFYARDVNSNVTNISYFLIDQSGRVHLERRSDEPPSI